LKPTHETSFGVIFFSLILLFSILPVTTFSQADSVFVKLSNDSVTIWNTNVIENCASRFTYSITFLDSNIIVLTEIDTVGPLMSCDCKYDLSTTLVGLGIGHYTVSVYRQYLKQYHYGWDTTVCIGSTAFIIGNPSVIIYASRFHQSECLNDAVNESERQRPTMFGLVQNYPNPFNPSTQITYSIPKPSLVTLRIYDILGREVATLVNEKKQPQKYTVHWNAEGIPSGVYFFRLVAGDIIQVRKMLLIR
jgi:hypothetical protein